MADRKDARGWEAAWGSRQTQVGLSFNALSATYWGFHGSSEVKKKKNPPINAGDVGSIPGWERSPEKENGNSHSSILAWEIPWTEELGGLQSLGSQRVRHDLVTKQP